MMYRIYQLMNDWTTPYEVIDDVINKSMWEVIAALFNTNVVIVKRISTEHAGVTYNVATFHPEGASDDHAMVFYATTKQDMNHFEPMQRENSLKWSNMMKQASTNTLWSKSWTTDIQSKL